MADSIFDTYMERSPDGMSDSPVLGGGIRASSPENVTVRYFTACLTNESEKLVLENIMTRSLMCRDTLEKPGDVRVIEEAGTFDKEGCYHVAIKYFEMVDPNSAGAEDII